MFATSRLEDAAAWVALPLVFVVTALGVALLIERVLGLRLSAQALLPLGTCAGLCLLLPVYQVGGTGVWAAVVLVLAAAAGLLLSRDELRHRLRPGAGTAAGVAVAVLYLAPAVLSGHWTWYGYNFLNDTAVQFLLADDLKHHGVALLQGELSTRSESIRAYIDSGYPLGSHAQLATLATLTGTGVDTIYQSYIAMLAVSAGVALSGVARTAGLAPWRAAVAGFGALAASLVYHYALQGSIKEIAAFTALTAAAQLGMELLRSDRPVRAVVPVGVAAAAMVSAYSAAAGPYLVLLALALAAAALTGRNPELRRRLLPAAAVGAVVVVVAALPTLLSAFTFLRISNSTLSPDAGATSTLGQLQRPLEVIQIAGVWFSEEYALPVRGQLEPDLTSWLSWFVLVLAVVGGVLFAWRRQAGPLILLGTCVVATLVVAPQASDYADAKLLALATPVVVFTALAGTLAWRGRARVAGLVATGIALLALLGSSAFAYHGVRLAPVERLHALEAAVTPVAGASGILFDEVEEFGKYYGRAAPRLNVAFESITPRQAQPFGGGYHLDLDELEPDYVQAFDAIVVRTGPATSRPPANYRRVYRNRWYESWEKLPGTQVRRHLPVQSALDAGGFVRCRDVRALGARARPGDRLVAAPAPGTVQLPVVDAVDRPIGWPPLAKPAGVVEPRTPGIVEGEVRTQDRVYDAWVRASTGRRLSVSVDGRAVGSVEGLNTQGQWLPGGTVSLPAGAHTVRLERPGGGLGPGDGVTSVIGPVALVPRERTELRTLAPSRAEQLCGRRWDWIELVAG